MTNSGYIKLARKSLESGIWQKPPMYWKAWCYILLKANHKDTGNVKRGEAIISIKELQEACSYSVGYRKVIPTIKQIRSILEYLRNPDEGNNEGHMVGTTKVTNGMLIKVLNYDTYQSLDGYEGHNENRTKDLRRSSEGHNLYNKNDKNDKNKEVNTLCQLVIDYLNQKSGKAYRYTENNYKHIRARLNEGHTVEDCKRVIDIKCSQWKNDRKMANYLRPETLFGNKFESYLNEMSYEVKLPRYMFKVEDEPEAMSQHDLDELEAKLKAVGEIKA